MSTVERLRRLGKLGATASFGVAVFLIVFDLTLPYARFKDLMASELSSYGYDLEARYAGPAFGLGMTLKDIAVVSRVSGGKATRILIDKAKIGVSLLSYLFGHRAVGLTADVFAGRVAADVDMGKSDSGFTIEVAQIDLAEIPWLKNAINLPASGRLDVKLNLALPKQHLRESKGLLRWECNSCAIGDGKAKLVVASNPILAEGLGLPKIRLGDFSGKVVIDKGVGRLQGVELKSPDVEATIEGEIHLVQPAVASHVDLYVRFRLSDSLLRSSEKLKTIMEFTTQMGKRPDGFIGFRVAGTLANLSNVEWMKSSPFANVPVPGKPAVRSSLPVPRPPLAAAALARVPADPPPVAAIPPVTVAPPPPPAAPDPAPVPVAITAPVPAAPSPPPAPPEAPAPGPAPSAAASVPSPAVAPTSVPAAASAPGAAGAPTSSPSAAAAAAGTPAVARDEARHAAGEHGGGPSPLPPLGPLPGPPASGEEEATPTSAP
ncbi:MAG: type II secretion system protein GspN [Polyangia bacterium]|jgi:type II secretion system protein N